MNKILQRIAIAWAMESRLPCPRVVRRHMYYLLGAPMGCTVEPEDTARPPRPMGFRRGLPIKITRRR